MWGAEGAWPKVGDSGTWGEESSGALVLYLCLVYLCVCVWPQADIVHDNVHDRLIHVGRSIFA